MSREPTMRPQALTRSRGFTLIELLVALFITAVIFAMGYGAINQALKDRDALKARQDRLTAVQNTMRVLVQDFTQLAPRPVRDVLGQGSLPCLMGSPNGISLTAGSINGEGLGGSGGGLGGSASTLGGAGGTLGSSLGSGAGSSSSSSSSSSSESSDSGDGTAAADSDGASSEAEQQGLDLVVFTRAGWANPAGIQRPALARVAYRLENGTLKRVTWPELDIAQATTPTVRNLLDHVKSVQFSYLTDARQWSDQWPPFTNLTRSSSGANPMLTMRPLAIRITLELEDWGKIVRIIEVPT